MCVPRTHRLSQRSNLILDKISLVLFLREPQLSERRVPIASQIYPTVAELAGLPVPPIGCPGCVEGDSAAPLLEEPHRQWKRASFSQYARCANDATPITGYYQRCSGQARDTLSAMGYSVRTDSWRYTGEPVDHASHNSCGKPILFWRADSVVRARCQNGLRTTILRFRLTSAQRLRGNFTPMCRTVETIWIFLARTTWIMSWMHPSMYR